MDIEFSTWALIALIIVFIIAILGFVRFIDWMIEEFELAPMSEREKERSGGKQHSKKK